MAWKVIKSALHKIGRFTIVQDEVLLPNEEVFTFNYINFAKGVCILPITYDDRVICLRQYRHAVKSWQWELPAGMIDPEDGDPLTNAKRELKEETGFIAQSWTPLGSFYPSAGSTSEEIFLFLATHLEESGQSLETSEQIEVSPLTLDELKARIEAGAFKHGGGLAAIMRYLLLE